MRHADRPFSERVHSLLVRAYGMPVRDFAQEQVERVSAALNAARADRPPCEAVVLWLVVPTAFTLPGRFVYVSRRLLERCRSDDAAAFAVAHELAHHDLGHLHRFEAVIEHVPGAGLGAWVGLLLGSLERYLYSYENELAADEEALALCRRAGFDGTRCLQLFDVLEEYALDHHDDVGVFGSDEELELDPANAANPVDRLYMEWRRWMIKRHRTHPALVERVERLKMKLG